MEEENQNPKYHHISSKCIILSYGIHSLHSGSVTVMAAIACLQCLRNEILFSHKKEQTIDSIIIILLFQ